MPGRHAVLRSLARPSISRRTLRWEPQRRMNGCGRRQVCLMCSSGGRRELGRDLLICLIAIAQDQVRCRTLALAVAPLLGICPNLRSIGGPMLSDIKGGSGKFLFCNVDLGLNVALAWDMGLVIVGQYIIMMRYCNSLKGKTNCEIEQCFCSG